MGSKHLNTKENQKSLYAQQFEVRVEALKEKGLAEKEIKRDSKIKQLNAKIRQVDGAMARIAFLEQQTQKLLERKEQRKVEEAAAKLEARVSGKKAKGKKEAPEPKKAAASGKKSQAKAKGGAGGQDAKKKGK